MFTRYDEFVMAGNRSGSWQKLKAGVKNDGTIIALQARQYRLGGIGQGSQAGQPYIYRMGDTYREIYALHTNEDSSVAMRAPGHPQASFAVESLVDELAYKIKMDPHEEPARRGLSPAVGAWRERDWLVQTKSGCGWKCWSIETRNGLRCRHVGRRRKRPVQSRRDDLARWLRARCSRHAGSRHWNTHVHESDRRRRARTHDQGRQRADRQFETRECKSIRWIDNCSVVVAVSERRGDQSTHVDGGACRALAWQSETGRSGLCG